MKLKLLVLAFGLLFFSCSKKECPDCGTHGTCNESTSTCKCDIGYSGEKCNFEITPTLMTIQSVKIKQYSALNNGISWDAFSSYADPYFILYGNAGNQLFKSSYAEELPPNVSYTWFPVVTVGSTNPLNIVFYDYDSGSSDSPILDLFFVPYVQGLDFPAFATLQKGNTIIEISYSYQFF